MPKSPRPYPPQFREQIVELHRREFKVSAQTVRNWSRQAERDPGRRHDGLTSVEREELAKLQRENKRLRLEREILAKAARGGDVHLELAGARPAARWRSCTPTTP